jgi:hypothetical protein
VKQSIRSPICGECEPAFLADFKPGLRNLGAEVHEKSAVKLRDF